MTTPSPIIVALDFNHPDEVKALADQLSPNECRLKVGKELFTRCGPEIVRWLQDRGFEIFLDLKFHDIPNTVAGAVLAAADLGVWMVNVHASGGERMLTAAADALAKRQSSPWLIAVTVLTSMERSDLMGVGIDCEPLQQVQRLAGLSQRCGLDGVVCSSRETEALRGELGDDFLLVTPGIRPLSAEQGDQRRVATPADALADGSSYLVIGRPITRQPDPLAALRAINADLGIVTDAKA